MFLTHLVTLLDVNECNILGFCSQTCQNYIGSYKCGCVRGYKPDHLNHNKCKVEKGKVALLLTHNTEIRMADIAFHETTTAVENINAALAMVIVKIYLKKLQANYDFRIFTLLESKFFGLTL